jgi:hypothetical protein
MAPAESGLPHGSRVPRAAFVSALASSKVQVCTWAMTSTQREKAWRWARDLLRVAAEDGGVSYDTFAAVVSDRRGPLRRSL